MTRNEFWYIEPFAAKYKNLCLNLQLTLKAEPKIYN